MTLAHVDDALRAMRARTGCRTLEAAIRGGHMTLPEWTALLSEHDTRERPHKRDEARVQTLLLIAAQTLDRPASRLALMRAARLPDAPDVRRALWRLRRHGLLVTTRQFGQNASRYLLTEKGRGTLDELTSQGAQR